MRQDQKQSQRRNDLEREEKNQECGVLRVKWIKSFKEDRWSPRLNGTDRSIRIGMQIDHAFSNWQFLVTLTRAIFCQVMGWNSDFGGFKRKWDRGKWSNKYLSLFQEIWLWRGTEEGMITWKHQLLSALSGENSLSSEWEEAPKAGWHTQRMCLWSRTSGNWYSIYPLQSQKIQPPWRLQVSSPLSARMTEHHLTPPFLFLPWSAGSIGSGHQHNDNPL